MGFSDLISIVAGGALTGPLGMVTGLIGGILEGVKKHKLEQLSLKRLALMQGHEATMIDKEAEHASKMKAIDAETTISTADLANLATSIKSDKATYSNNFTAAFVQLAEGNGLKAAYAIFMLSMLMWVDVFKGFIRPSIACVLMYFNHQLAVVRTGEDGFALNSAAQAEVFMFSTSVGWYFGSRGVQVAMKTHKR